MMDGESRETHSAVLGCAVAGSLLCGVAGLACGLITVVANHDFAGGGMCLLAGAVGFGLLAGALLRD